MSFVFTLLLAVTAINLVRTATVYESFTVDSVIVSRYARTTITSVIYNSAQKSGEVSFKVKLPSTAYISNFTMLINDTTYLGVANDKRAAAEEFNRRQQDGENVGLVESRGTDVFQIRANTAAQSRSTFTLTYEELITRTLSKYRQVISLNPGSLVDNLSVSVRVVDSQGIASFSSTNFTSSNRISSDEVQFSYAPSKSDQNDNSDGLSRDIVVEYDVNHPADGSAGLVIVNDCYFAQFFSPGGVASIPIDIVFVIDTSGSMFGEKISQARSSLVEVISQLSAEDRFTIVTFSSSIGTWRNSLVSVGEFRQQGQGFARGLTANGGTDFFGGLERGIGILKSSQNSQYVQLLVMLSDGEPTVGVVDHDLIVNRATELTAGTRISVNMLGFGVNLNLLLLQRLALANRGIVKQIFEGSDAAAQLEGFYQSISNPILHTLRFDYPTDQIESVSNVAFPLLFQGSEVVVAGRFTDSVCTGNSRVSISVSGMGQSAVQTFTSMIDPAADTIIAGIAPDTERVVAYLTTQQLLNDIKVTSEAGAKVLEERAKVLALRYNFVTELTSLIVVEEDVYNEVIMNNSTNFTDTFGGVGSVKGGSPVVFM